MDTSIQQSAVIRKSSFMLCLCDIEERCWMKYIHYRLLDWIAEMSAADVKMEIPVLVRSLKSSILSSTSLRMDKTFWRVVSAVEQPRRKASVVASKETKYM